MIGIDRNRWYTALAGVIGQTLSSTGAPTRWRWPGRRDPRDIGGAMLPRWTGERPSVAVIIDTSSSVTAADLDMAHAAGTFVGRIADTVYWGCDTTPTRYGSSMPERLRGGGGTNLVNGIEAAVADGAKAIVIITDCMTPWPTDPLNIPVIVAANAGADRYVTGAGAQFPGYAPPDWMTVVPVVLGD